MTISVRSVFVLSIAMGVSQREAQKATFIISLISHALFDHKFDPYRQQWILSSTLATILCYHDEIPNWIHFDGKELVQALSGRNFRLLEEYNLIGVINDSFEDNHS